MHPSDTLVYRPLHAMGVRLAKMTPFCVSKVVIEGPLFSGGCHERAPRSDIFGSERQWYTEGVFASLEGPGGVSPWQPPKKSGHSEARMSTFCDTIIPCAEKLSTSNPRPLHRFSCYFSFLGSPRPRIPRFLHGKKGLFSVKHLQFR